MVGSRSRRARLKDVENKASQIRNSSGRVDPDKAFGLVRATLRDMSKDEFKAMVATPPEVKTRPKS